MSRSPDAYPTSAFDYELPPERIARHPAARRDESRLLVVDRAGGSLTHRTFHDLPELIPPGDALVLNETRVLHARLLGTRPGGGAAEVLLLHPLGAGAADGGERESGGGGEWVSVAGTESAGDADAPRPAHRGGHDSGLPGSAPESGGPGEGGLAGRTGTPAGTPGAHGGAEAAEAGGAHGGGGAAKESGGPRDVPPPRASPPPPLSPSPGQHGAGRTWAAMVRPGAKLRPGRRVRVAEGFEVEVLDVLADGSRVVRLETALPVAEALAHYGQVPLPPYLGRAPEPEDEERYQTVYARAEGSVAAPTAGLHFTRALLETLEARGVRLVRLVLHVGAGTFRPVETEDPAEHPMHAEWYRVPAAAAAALGEVRAAGGRIWAVGTTVARTLETAVDEAGLVRAGEGWTDLFIRPPYRFRAVDRLITNFHLPRSTLLMLVAALAGHELTMRAYREAVRAGYRFYSYGDAMVVL